jgi:hypothetical protein
MRIFSGKNSSKTNIEHIHNILKIIRLALKNENTFLNKIGYNFYDAYKEFHFLSIMNSALRSNGYATILEDSETKKHGESKIRNDMVIWYGKNWDIPITFELKMIWATDRNDKIDSFINDIVKLNEADNRTAYICAALYLYNKKYENRKRRKSTENLIKEKYQNMSKLYRIRHRMLNLDGNSDFDFSIYPPNNTEYDYNLAEIEEWDRCRLIYCAKAS